MMIENVDVGNNMANGTPGVCTTGVKLIPGNYIHHSNLHDKGSKACKAQVLITFASRTFMRDMVI
jgi:hypothetical protein